MMRPLNTALELAVQNALVEFVTRPVRLGVVDHGVIVHVLRTVDQVQAVHGGFGAFGQRHPDVIAHQRTAERDVMGGEIRAAPQRHLHGGHVERLRRLALDLVMVDHRAIAGDNFRHGIGEVVALAFISLDDGALRAGATTISVRGCTATESACSGTS